MLMSKVNYFLAMHQETNLSSYPLHPKFHSPFLDTKQNFHLWHCFVLSNKIPFLHFKVSLVTATTEIRVAIYQRPLSVPQLIISQKHKINASPTFFIILAYYFPLSVSYKSIFMASTLITAFASEVLSSLQAVTYRLYHDTYLTSYE